MRKRREISNVKKIRRAIKHISTDEYSKIEKKRITWILHLGDWMKYGVALFVFALLVYGAINGKLSIPRNFEETRQRVAILTMLLSLAVPSFLSSRIKKNISETEISNQSLIRNNWRKIHYYWYFSYVVLLIALIIGDIPKGNSGLHLSFILFIFLHLLYEGMVIIGFEKPKMIFNDFIVVFSEGVRVTYNLPYFWMLFAFIYPAFIFNIWIVVGHLLITVLMSYLIRTRNKKEIIYHFENDIIRFTEINKLKMAFSGIIRKNKNEKRAKAEFDARIKQGDHEYLQALAIQVRGINGETGVKWSYLFMLIFSLFYFFVSSIGEGLIQDMFNDDIKELICNLLGLLCE